MTFKTFTRDNLGFSVSKMQNRELWVLNVTRVSDGHWLRPQWFLDTEPSEADLPEIVEEWLAAHCGTEEPPAVHCYSCGARLISDMDTGYQFDNALWLGFHGGYSMFVDNMDATLPINTDTRWAVDENRNMVETEGWEPKFNEPRVLPGHPDFEAVICHDCAHDLCIAVPWVGRLLDPERSHVFGQSATRAGILIPPHHSRGKRNDG